MKKPKDKINSSDEKSMTEIVRDFSWAMLNEGQEAGDICFNLIAVGMELSLARAPSPEHAFALAASALARVTSNSAPEVDENGVIKEEVNGTCAIGKPASASVH
jgi:hypothetical protein